MAAGERGTRLRAVGWINFVKTAGIGLACLVAALVWVVPSNSWGADRLQMSLSQLTGYPVGEMRGNRAYLNVKVPVPRRWRVETAHLHMEYINSEALIPQRSKLVVRMNGYPLTQTTLLPHSPAGRIDTDIPAPYLLPGYNDLDIQVFQNYALECNDPNAPELWTSVDLEKSFIEMDYSLKAIPLSLAAVSTYLFDPKTPEFARVHIALERFDPTFLKLGLVTAAAVANHFDYRPVHFSISSVLVPGRDNLIIGRRDFVREALNGGTLPEGDLGVMHLPGADGDRWGLVIMTGPDDAGVEKTVKGFSVMTGPLPDSASVSIPDLHLPEVDRYTGKKLMTPDHNYSFQELGVDNQIFTGDLTWGYDLSFRIPTDYLVRSNKAVLLTVHLAYGAKMRSDSVLNVLLNGFFTAAIPLDDTNGGNYLAYKIEIPNRLLEPGMNRLTFQPVLTPSETGECRYYQINNLQLVIYNDSTIVLPEMEHWGLLPELGHLFKDGFPLAKWPDWRETTVWLPENSFESAGAAVNLVAAICQKNRVCPWGITVQIGNLTETDRDLLVAGPLDRLPPDLAGKTYLNKTVHYLVQGEAQPSRQMSDWVRKWRGDQIEKMTGADVSVESTLTQGRLLVEEFESPYKSERSVVLMTAREVQALEQGALSLWDPAVQNRISKSLAILDITGGEEMIWCYKAGPRYHVGKIDKINVLDHFIHERPWVFFLALVVVVVILAWILTIILRRRRRKRLANDPGAK